MRVTLLRDDGVLDDWSVEETLAKVRSHQAPEEEIEHFEVLSGSTRALLCYPDSFSLFDLETGEKTRALDSYPYYIGKEGLIVLQDG